MPVLLIVDYQNDFCPGGALGVDGGDKIVTRINDLMDHFSLIVASKDWHPSETVHFVKWPPHCIQGSHGAEFHPELHSEKFDEVFLKGTGNKDNGYSAFEATNMNLADYLKDKNCKKLFICGLTTEYCIRSTALDAARLGFKTHVFTDAISAVNPEDGEKALNEMKENGIRLVHSEVVPIS